VSVDERRENVAKARQWHIDNAGSPSKLSEDGPLPEFYPGHYDDMLGLPHHPDAVELWWAGRGVEKPKP
jgi:hypothetical protein